MNYRKFAQWIISINWALAMLSVALSHRAESKTLMILLGVVLFNSVIALVLLALDLNRKTRKNNNRS